MENDSCKEFKLTFRRRGGSFSLFDGTEQLCMYCLPPRRRYWLMIIVGIVLVCAGFAGTAYENAHDTERKEESAESEPLDSAENTATDGAKPQAFTLSPASGLILLGAAIVFFTLFRKSTEAARLSVDFFPLTTDESRVQLPYGNFEIVGGIGRDTAIIFNQRSAEALVMSASGVLNSHLGAVEQYKIPGQTGQTIFRRVESVAEAVRSDTKILEIEKLSKEAGESEQLEDNCLSLSVRYDKLVQNELSRLILFAGFWAMLLALEPGGRFQLPEQQTSRGGNA
ncbi:MAG: hypothetical protein NUW37_15865 [Planctomycetes bacterium]|nr:hypothetical protein [Planctomycetota bacterium]